MGLPTVAPGGSSFAAGDHPAGFRIARVALSDILAEELGGRILSVADHHGFDTGTDGRLARIVGQEGGLGSVVVVRRINCLGDRRVSVKELAGEFTILRPD